VNPIHSVIQLILADVAKLRDNGRFVTQGALEEILLERLPMLEPEDAIAVQLRRLNDNLEAGVTVRLDVQQFETHTRLVAAAAAAMTPGGGEL
jgi:hypothetical protein